MVSKLVVDEEHDKFQSFPESISKAITDLWKDSGIQHCYHEVANNLQDTIQ
jgi:hypothetical protein